MCVMYMDLPSISSRAGVGSKGTSAVSTWVVLMVRSAGKVRGFPHPHIGTWSKGEHQGCRDGASF